MGDRLQIYKGALRLLGDGTIESLSEANTKRLKLDEAWAPSVQYMLERGLWNFAIRTIKLDADTDVEPLFGYSYAFSRPDDFVRINDITDDANFHRGFEDFQYEAGNWFARVDTLYLRYVSSGTSYGWNIGAWPQTFCKCLEAYLAFECGLPISNDKTNRDDLFSLHEKRLRDAKSKDAIEESVARMPAGRLVRSRFAYGSSMGRQER